MSVKSISDLKYFDPNVSKNQTNHAILFFSWRPEFNSKVAVFRDSLFEIIPNIGLLLQAIFVNPKTGEIEANADFRKQGEVDGF